MTFKWPLLLWLLLLVPLAVLGYALWQRRRTARLMRFASPAMLPNVMPVTPGWRRHVPPVFYALALGLLVVAIARPQAAFSVPRERATVMLVIDTSRSMLARDVDPNRLEAARRAADALLSELPPRFLVGVVGFADRAKTLNRPTTDRVAVRAALASIVTRSGTAIGEGVASGVEVGREVAQAGNNSAPLVLLLLSDGNNTTGVEPTVAARRARERGIRIHTIALGTTGPPSGVGPKPPNFEALEQIAEMTGGRFFEAPDGGRLESIYRGLGSEISSAVEHREITSAFVAAGALLLIVGAATAMAWSNRLP